MQKIVAARNAMATRFELVLHGENPVALRAAAEEALGEIERLEAQLSLYRPTSEIAHVNARAAAEPVRVSPNVFRLLQHARELHQETGGAFDITIAPLVKCWGFMGGTGRLPEPAVLEAARAKVGMAQVELDEANFSVRFRQPGIMLDLGAIGKGYALNRASEWLREAGVASALLNAGTSTIYAVGHPPEAEFWKVALDLPPEAGLPGGRKHLATVSLRDDSLSVSAVWGRAFQAGEKMFGHVLDPRLGQPVADRLLAAVVLPSATETDALSTALLVGGEAGHAQIAALRPQIRTLLVCGNTQSEASYRVTNHGIPHAIPNAD